MKLDKDELKLKKTVDYATITIEAVKWGGAVALFFACGAIPAGFACASTYFSAMEFVTTIGEQGCNFFI